MLLLCCYKHFTPLFFYCSTLSFFYGLKKIFHLLEIEHEGEIQKASKILLFPLIG